MTSLSRSASSRTSAPKFDVRDFTDRDIDWFSQLLFIEEGRPMSDRWFKKQEESMKKFPARFLRPKNLITRTVTNLASYFECAPANAQLCKTHKVLNARVIRAFFVLVAKECTAMIESYTGYSDLPKDVTAWINRLHSLNSLWLSPDLYERVFQVSPNEPRHQFVEGGCEACILARIGGNTQAIYDLECSAYARSLRRNRNGDNWVDCRDTEKPRILKLLDGWMNERGMDDENNTLYAKSLSLIEQVGKVRWEILEKRQQAKRDARNKGINPPTRQPSTTGSSSRPDHKFIIPIPEESENAEDEEGGVNDDQGEVETLISFYENRQSMMGQPPAASPMHPAFQRPSSYSDNVYSQPGGAYDTQNPYMPPPLRLPPKTPAEKPKRPAPGPPPSAAEAFFIKNAETDWGKLEGEWEDETVRTEASSSTPSLLSKREADRRSAYHSLFGTSPSPGTGPLFSTRDDDPKETAERTSENRAALAPSPSPGRRGRPSVPQDEGLHRGRGSSFDQGSMNTTWGDFYK